MSGRTIHDVVAELGEVVETCRREELRAGYFAALYRRVTMGVRDWIAEGRFDDGPRMERLDVLFADRYLDAWRAWREGRPTSRSWAVAFAASQRWWPVTLQHLLLGVNAHINLDLAVATARTAPGGEVRAMEDDFLRINDLLASMVDDVQERLAGTWPLLRLLDWVGGRTDEATVHFSIDRARREAWAFALRLSEHPEEAWVDPMDRADHVVAALGGLVERPGPLLGSTLRFVRLGELRSTREIIDLLA